MLSTLLCLFSACEQENLTPNEPTPPANSIAAGTTLTVLSVDQFTWLRGNNNWTQDSRNRLPSSRFIFKNGGNFTCTYKHDSVTTITLNGKYFEGSNGRYSFYAFRNTNNGAGSGTQVLVEGTIISNADGNTFQVNMEFASQAVYSAIVNNQHFFDQAPKRFRTTMTVR